MLHESGQALGVGSFSLPSVLIRPDGKIIAVVSEAEKLSSVVSKALQATSKPAKKL